jgi:hypothetical protein
MTSPQACALTCNCFDALQAACRASGHGTANETHHNRARIEVSETTVLIRWLHLPYNVRRKLIRQVSWHQPSCAEPASSHVTCTTVASSHAPHNNTRLRHCCGISPRHSFYTQQQHIHLLQLGDCKQPAAPTAQCKTHMAQDYANQDCSTIETPTSVLRLWLHLCIASASCLKLPRFLPQQQQNATANAQQQMLSAKQCAAKQEHT